MTAKKIQKATVSLTMMMTMMMMMLLLLLLLLLMMMMMMLLLLLMMMVMVVVVVMMTKMMIMINIYFTGSIRSETTLGNHRVWPDQTTYGTVSRLHLSNH